ncbi:tetratricopeptide repeat protein [Nannocystis sp. ncelm1]|uniref:Tetratricopeptide repeat protein n=2 Tax=Nannocystis radixulma TaxID=2995305 RepID=A0ABT5BPM1_9BACT|nr:tetratricopeptide repeat protein [Nannocystis radixulma]
MNLEQAPMPVDPTHSSQLVTRVDGLAPAPERARRADPDDDVGPAKIGRFVVLRKLGEGGMGVVYSAYDEQLERKVALKLLRGEFRGQQQSVGQARLLREAQAMAKLSHPNVAQVYDVGPFGDAVFIAMEMVSGGNLKSWLQREDRPWRAILGVYLQAGHGLAAAHGAGLVHRDFKPDNVLVGDDGRVRVVDFGLARHDEHAMTPPGAPPPSASGVDLTQVGTYIGTPAYMAPEQLLLEPADALSDQFSFCVALFEGLYGYRPFKGATTAEISKAVLEDRRLDPPRDSEVPGWVHAALVRGLSIDPAQRFPTMDALLQVLSADPDLARRRRLGVAAAAAGVMLFASAGGYAAHAIQARDAATCVGADEQLAGVWDPSVARAVRGALTATGAAYADEVATRVGQRLGEYAGAWVDMRRGACESHRRGEQSDSLYDLRVACLDDRKTALRALVGVLTTADAAVLEKAVQAADQLPTLARCADTRALLARSPAPDDPAVARAVDDLRARLAGVQAKFDVGQFKAARAELEPLRAEAEALAHAPTLAATLHLAGKIDDQLGDYPNAEATLLRTAATADRAGDDDLRAAATIDLVRTVGVRQARFDEGLHLAELARGATGRLSDGGTAEALLEGRLGDLLLTRGDLDRAAPHIDRAVELRAQLHGETSIAHGQALISRGTLKFLRGDYPAAIAEYRRVLAIFEQTYGAHHPVLGDVLNNIGAAELSQFHLDDAEATFTRTLAIVRGAYGDSHPALATVHFNLGLIAQFEARYPDSLAALRQALAIYDAHLPPAHPSRGDGLIELGNTHLFAGDFTASEQSFADALAIFHQAFGTGHPRTTQALAGMATAQLRAGRVGDAERTFQRALAELERDPADPTRGVPLAGLGRVHLAAGRHAAAVEALEQALPLLPQNAFVAPYDIAEAQFALARALVLLDPANAARSRDLAAQAKARFLGVGAAFQPAAAEVDAWLSLRAG